MAIVNNVAVMWECKYLFKLLISILLDKYPEVGLLDHTAVLFLILRRTSILFTAVAAQIYIPTNNVQGFQFLHILTNIYLLFCFVFHNDHPNRCEAIFHDAFDLLCPGD